MARGGKRKTTGSKLSYEAKLWQMADALRNKMDVARYKYVFLSLIFREHCSTAFGAKQAELACLAGVR